VVSESLQPTLITNAEIAERLQGRAISSLKLYSAQTHAALFALAPYLKELTL
jgi:hypothetical protein